MQGLRFTKIYYNNKKHHYVCIKNAKVILNLYLNQVCGKLRFLAIKAFFV